jgi:hypothetical protein
MPSPPCAPLFRRSSCVEGLEEPRQHVLCDAAAVVLHPYDGLVVLGAGARAALERKLDRTAFVGVFPCVREQIAHDL